MNQYVSPPTYAKQLGVKPAKVISWIREGKLRAVNTSDGERPRWKISADAITEFELRRGATLLPPQTHKRRKACNVIPYY